jgi:hypothetical protein
MQRYRHNKLNSVQANKFPAGRSEHSCQRTDEESLTLILEAMDDLSQKSSIPPACASTIEIVDAKETVTAEIRAWGFR